ncbi:hypothetical protein HK096_003461, partial [Nowakowskiella sp. JEL0078]
MPTTQEFAVIFINPVSGTKQAQNVWQNIVRPKLSSENWHEISNSDFLVASSSNRSDLHHYPFVYTVFTSLAPLHSAEFVSRVVLSASNLPTIPNGPKPRLTFVCLGGDGLIHEIINGALKGSELKFKIRLCVVPCGTGNALATSIGIVDHEDAVRRLINGKIRSLTVGAVSIKNISVNTTNKIEFPSLNDVSSFKNYFFCVVSWGMHAQIVKQSETFRFLGSLRFQLIARLLLLFLKQYPAKLYLAHASQRQNKLSSTSSENQTLLNNTDSGIPKIWQELPSGSTNEAIIYDPSNSGYETFSQESSTLKFSYFLSTWMSSLERGFNIAPFANSYSVDTVDIDRRLDLILGVSLDRFGLTRMLVSASNGSHVEMDDANVRFLKVKGYCLVPETSNNTLWGWFQKLFGIREKHDICVD